MTGTHNAGLDNENLDVRASESGTFYTGGSQTTGSWTLQSMGLDTILKGDEYYYVQQKFGICSIVLAAGQLLYLTTTFSICGVAPFDVNPSIGPYPDALSGYGGINPYYLSDDDQYWRFLTVPLLNAGVIHLLLNGAILLETGAFFEREWGSIQWFFIYSMTSIGSVMFGVIINPNEITVGSSGPLMGLFGAKIAQLFMIVGPVDLFSCNFDDYEDVDGNQILSILCSLAFTSLLPVFPYVSGGCHLGGLLTGFFIGMFVFASGVRHMTMRRLWRLAGLIFTLLLFILGFYGMKKIEADAFLADPCYYYQYLQNENYDCTCGD